MVQPYVFQILTASNKGVGMVTKSSVEVIAGKGIKGDRYEAGTGTYSGKRNVPRDITLIHLMDIREANKIAETTFSVSDTRRNIVVIGDINLQTLIGRRFSICNVEMEGVEECTPCSLPDRYSGKTGFVKAFANGRGGIRAKILTDGKITRGDNIIVK